MCCSPAFSQRLFTTYQTTFCEIPSPQSLSVRATARKIRPSVIRAAFVHSLSGCELLVDGVSRQPARFEVHAVASNHDPVECQARLGAVPCYELVEAQTRGRGAIRVTRGC